MQFSEEWKSLFPISLLHSPPLLLSNNPSFGPLFFNPAPKIITNTLCSPTNFTPLLLPPPDVSLPRFVENATLYVSFGAILHTPSNAIASSFGPQHYNATYSDLLQNRFVSLRCPNNWVIVFFPTGVNLDSVGFVILRVEEGNVSFVHCGYHDAVFTSSIKFDHQIIRMVPCSFCDSEDLGYVGYLVVCTMYSAHWFSVRIRRLGSEFERLLDYMGGKNFKSCVVYACWNPRPRLMGECVILLETGELFLFDMGSSCFKGKTIRVIWNKLGVSVEDKWFSCEFSWHSRILIVANSKAVFLVDFRFKCQPVCLLKTEMLGSYTVSENEKLVAFSKAGNDGFFFIVASTHLLLLCDVRKPLMPVLRWTHNLHNPCHMAVLPLSELRSHPTNETYQGTSEMAFGIVLGSLWDNEFCLFCYGRPISSSTQYFPAKTSKISDSFYAWEHPSELNLSGRCCGCGNCLLKEDIAKNDLPEWIDWQQKKEMVLGFFILDKDLSSSFPGTGEHGGFTLVRLMSSGKLETQQYCASWKMATTCHEVTQHSKDSLLCDMGDDEYKFTKRFEYVKLEYLFAHLNNNLTRLLFSRFKNTHVIGCADECSNEFRKFMMEKLKSFGCAPPISYLSPSDIFSDVNMPTSMYEIVSRLMWINLPMTSLELAFVPHRHLALEFLNISDQNQAPPFFFKMPSHYYVNKRSSKITHGSDFVGPVVPLHALLVLYEISRNGHSFASQVNDYLPETSIALKCKPVMLLTKDLGITCGSNKQDEEDAVSLGNDKDDDPRSLFLYEPSAFSNELPRVDGEDPINFLQEREMLISKIAKSKHREDGKAPKLFDELCPVELKFNSEDQAFDREEMNSYQYLKKHFLKWQHDFHPYQNIYDRLKQ